MFASTEQNKQLYIPDFKLWDDYYVKKVNAQKDFERASQPSCSKEPSDNSVVKLKLVSPIAQTTDQAESIMKTDAHKESRKKKAKKSKSKNKAKGKSTQHRKQTGIKKPAFTFRKLSDIFSKGKK